MKKLYRSSLGMALLLANGLCLGSVVGAAADPIKVGIVAVNADVPTVNRMVVTATAAAKKKGWEVESFFGRGDQVAVNNAAAAYIDRGFNAIINIASPIPK